MSYVCICNKISEVDLFHLFEDSLVKSMAKDYVLISCRL